MLNNVYSKNLDYLNACFQMTWFFQCTLSLYLLYRFAGNFNVSKYCFHYFVGHIHSYLCIYYLKIDVEIHNKCAKQKKKHFSNIFYKLLSDYTCTCIQKQVSEAKFTDLLLNNFSTYIWHSVWTEMEVDTQKKRFLLTI